MTRGTTCPRNNLSEAVNRDVNCQQLNKDNLRIQSQGEDLHYQTQEKGTLGFMTQAPQQLNLISSFLRFFALTFLLGPAYYCFGSNWSSTVYLVGLHHPSRITTCIFSYSLSLSF